ncbi:MAG: NUDIX domain-containing protein [Firmicutes bacterium]|nr:NUDIX domain-containing protein [Bacillota bacterium]
MNQAQLKFHAFAEISEIPDEKLTHAAVVSRFKGKWIFVRHKERSTWEIPGGRRNEGENIIDTAKRELFEETGATDFEIRTVCVYIVMREKPSYGLLAFAEIKKMGELPISEIEKIGLFDEIPDEQTYPNIHPKLIEKFIKSI